MAKVAYIILLALGLCTFFASDARGKFLSLMVNTINVDSRVGWGGGMDIAASYAVNKNDGDGHFYIQLPVSTGLVNAFTTNTNRISPKKSQILHEKSIFKNAIQIQL